MSLAAIDAKISAKRRALANLIDARTTAFAKLDSLSAEIDALQAKASLTADEQTVLNAKIAEHKNARNEALKAGDTISEAQSEISALESERSARQAHEVQVASLNAAQPRVTPPSLEVDAASQVRVVERPETAEEQDRMLDAMFRNAFIAKVNGQSLVAVCAGAAGDAYKHDRLRAALLTSNNPSLVPTNLSQRLVEIFRPASVLTNLDGIRYVPLPNGNLTMPRQTGTSTATYTGEMANIPLSDLTTDNFALQAKKLTAMSVQSGEMLRRSSPDTDAMVRDDFVQTIGTKTDITMIRNTASLTLIPKGLKWFADQNPVGGIGQGVIRSNQANTIQSIKNDLGKAKLKLANANVPNRKRYWLMSERTAQFLYDLVDANGNPAFPEMERGLLRQIPYRTTTQIPDNLTTDTVTNCSEVYLVEATEILFGTTPTFELQVSIEAAYFDGTQMQASFSQDAAVFRLITEHDMQLRHATAVAYIEKVTWGKD